MDISERNFEASIEADLLAGGPDAVTGTGVVQEAAVNYSEAYAAGGYHRRASSDYDRALCVIRRDVLTFIYASQPDEWQKLQRQVGADAERHFFQRLAHDLQAHDTLHVLRKGISLTGCHFRLAYFRPASGLNPTHQQSYLSNIFSVVRQLHYSAAKPDLSLDLALFLNGLPLFTAELKNDLTGQQYLHAIHQYREDRDPKEPLFAFGRCLAHFAVDPNQVHVTTHLEGKSTRFLPFNQGYDGGAGNPPNRRDWATVYLWRAIWARDSVLNLIQSFAHIVEEEDDKGNKTGKRSLIFPRYHQLDAVRRLIVDARLHGPNQKYLIQHSAGSGKSNTIAWLAHQLATLHDGGDQRIFDSIIVISDRRVLDRQLQQTVAQFELTRGIVENINKSSHQLKDALESGKTIIVTTLQKFPFILKDIVMLGDKRFAVIIDEAHSSQSGEGTSKMYGALSAATHDTILEEAARDEDAWEAEQDDPATRQMAGRKMPPNMSAFAFTATPKPKTLETFGAKDAAGQYAAFSTYSMRQAIEERFIIDVLQNYTTYKVFWTLRKTVESDPDYNKRDAQRVLRTFVELHPNAIAEKVAIILEHFKDHVAWQIKDTAKAMIVTRSRLHAVLYKQEVDRALQRLRLPYKALVAFSGTVKEGDIDYTEAGMNGFPDTQTAEMFKHAEFRLLIVADKYQTGFDQPLLQTMYVDKKLGGVKTVQTLSRLNRTAPDKEATMVLDFANDQDEIENAFAPYYETTILSGGTDPNLLYDLQTRLLEFGIFTDDEVEAFAAIWFDGGSNQARLQAVLAPLVMRFNELSADGQVDFRGQLNDYVRLYSFLAQIITFTDGSLEKLYQFARILFRKLPLPPHTLPREIQQAIDLDSFRVQETGKGRVKLQRGATALDPRDGNVTYIAATEERESLSQIIATLNQRFGMNLTESEGRCILEIEGRLDNDERMTHSAQVNMPDEARRTFDIVVEDALSEIIDGHFKFYQQINRDEHFRHNFVSWLFDRYMTRPPTPL